jgi:hypothetical protein
MPIASERHDPAALEPPTTTRLGGNPEPRYAAQRAEVCIPPASSERHALPSALKPCRPPRRHRRKRPKPRCYCRRQRAEVLHPTRRRPAKGTIQPMRRCSPADHHGAVGGNAISQLNAAQRAEVLHHARPAKGTIPAAL